MKQLNTIQRVGILLIIGLLAWGVLALVAYPQQSALHKAQERATQAQQDVDAAKTDQAAKQAEVDRLQARYDCYAATTNDAEMAACHAKYEGKGE